MTTDWVTYISQEEDANYGLCYGHREQHGLPTDDLAFLECETDCLVCDTCPLVGPTIEKIEDYEQQLRNLFPPEEV